MQGTTSATEPMESWRSLVTRAAPPIRPTQVRTPDETISVSTRELCDGDTARVDRLYAFLLSVCDYLQPRLHDPNATAGVIALLERAGFDRIHNDASGLGDALRRQSASQRLRKAYHDLRGGSLLALLMHLELVTLGLSTLQDLTRIHILSRDHLKIMRNAISDLDPVRREADLSTKDHSIALLEQKWSSVDYRIGGRGIRVDLDCEFEGVVASCCMEFSTLDRVIYNLVNNAARHALDGRVRLRVESADETDSDHTLLRIAALNRIDAAHGDELRRRFGGDDMGRLFQGGFTTGGRGLGLRICGDLVTHGFSLPSIEDAVERGYLGARLFEDWFAVWFHWPARRTTPTAES